jgi:vacuolar-type H+-ATPase catalytic subunit A/Vma1
MENKNCQNDNTCPEKRAILKESFALFASIESKLQRINDVVESFEELDKQHKDILGKFSLIRDEYFSENEKTEIDHTMARYKEVTYFNVWAKKADSKLEHEIETFRDLEEAKEFMRDYISDNEQYNKCWIRKVTTSIVTEILREDC